MNVRGRRREGSDRRNVATGCGLDPEADALTLPPDLIPAIIGLVLYGCLDSKRRHSSAGPHQILWGVHIFGCRTFGVQPSDLLLGEVDCSAWISKGAHCLGILRHVV